MGNEGAWDKGDEGVHDRGEGDVVWSRDESQPVSTETLLSEERPVYNDEIDRLTAQREHLRSSLLVRTEPKPMNDHIEYPFTGGSGTTALASIYEQTPDTPERTTLTIRTPDAEIIFDGNDASVRQGAKEELASKPPTLKPIESLTPKELQLAEKAIGDTIVDIFTGDID